jgi:hypothetical protein
MWLIPLSRQGKRYCRFQLFVQVHLYRLMHLKIRSPMPA